jgi:TonB family protein
MTFRSRKDDGSTKRALLAALVVSLLLHQVLLTGVVSRFLPEDVAEPDRTEIVLREEEPPPPPAPEPVKPAPEPAPERAPAPIPVPVRPPVPVPSPSPAAEEPPAGVPMGPPSPEPLPTAPEPPSPRAFKTDMDWASFDRAFGDVALADREEYHRQSMEKRRGTVRMGSLTGKVREALRNNRSWVSDGEQVPLGKKATLFHNYLAVAHERIHTLFADSFLASINVFDPSDPLNNMELMTKMEFEILSSGVVNEIRVLKSSGNTVFDAAAVDSIYRSSPFNPPPATLLSYNDRVYFRWGFYRNHRKCGVFNAEPYLLKAPGAAPEAIAPEKFDITGG